MSATLISTLTEQHRELEGLMQKVTVALHSNELAAVRATLHEFGHALLMHLALEDEQLYPQLLKQHSMRSSNGRLVRTFAENMMRVSTALKTFLKRPQETEEDVAALRREWPEVENLLASRIQSEERLLYPTVDLAASP
ncbi:MAG: hemerythrin domain-containing protein [Myxococcaceae bacterium]